MSLFEKPSAQTAADVKPANTEAEPVEAKVGGEDVQTERHYTATDLERIVKDRLARENKKFEKERAEWQNKITAAEKSPKKDAQVSPNIEAEWQSKLAEYETKNRTLAEQLDKYREQTLNATIERELLTQGCVDAEVVMDHFKSRNLVHQDEDGNVIVENISGKLEDLVKDYLAKKPHLKRAESVGGAGTKGPKVSVETLTERDQLRAQIASTMGKGKPLFGK